MSGTEEVGVEETVEEEQIREARERLQVVSEEQTVLAKKEQLANLLAQRQRIEAQNNEIKSKSKDVGAKTVSYAGTPAAKKIVDAKQIRSMEDVVYKVDSLMDKHGLAKDRDQSTSSDSDSEEERKSKRRSRHRIHRSGKVRKSLH